jgi:hypothetical protein
MLCYPRPCILCRMWGLGDLLYLVTLPHCLHPSDKHCIIFEVRKMKQWRLCVCQQIQVKT